MLAGKMKKTIVHTFQEAWRLYHEALHEMPENDEDALINPDDWLQERDFYAAAWSGAVVPNSRIADYVLFMINHF